MEMLNDMHTPEGLIQKARGGDGEALGRLIEGGGRGTEGATPVLPVGDSAHSSFSACQSGILFDPFRVYWSREFCELD